MGFKPNYLVVFSTKTGWVINPRINLAEAFLEACEHAGADNLYVAQILPPDVVAQGVVKAPSFTELLEVFSDTFARLGIVVPIQIFSDMKLRDLEEIAIWLNAMLRRLRGENIEILPVPEAIYPYVHSSTSEL